jgi:long-chain acyl-CoA synthetase
LDGIGGRIMDTLKTLPDMLKNSVKKYRERSAFKIKEEGKFLPITYQELYHKIRCFGTGLHHIGINKFDHVGLVSENRLEWMISDMAIIHLRAADVPCSGNSSPQDIYFKLHHSDANAVILEGEKQLINFFQVKEKLPEIKNVILIEKIQLFSEEEEAPEWATPVHFEEKHHISEKLEKKILNFIKHKNIFFFLSPHAKTFLEKYLKNNKEQLLAEPNSEYSTDLIRHELFQRLIVINKENDKNQPYNIYSFQEISKIGQRLLDEGDTNFDQLSKTTREDDLATIIYTSGTTSDPKGVMLTHANFMHNILVTPPVQEINQNDHFLSVLPSWHIFERTSEYIALGAGASTAYSKPFKQILIPDLAEEKPTIMISVPRIWESVYQGAISKAEKGSSLQRKIFNWAFDIGKKYKKAERILSKTFPLFDQVEFTPEEIKQAQKTVTSLGWQYRLADTLVFKKIRAITGGQLRFAISGGGALPENVDNFFDVAGIMVCEGYGLTETSPVLCARNPKYCIISTVGPSLPEVEIKIVDKDNLHKELPHGETGVVLTKGPMTMKGYYKNEEKTNQVIQKGWFNTGDLGRKTKNGKFLQLVGRTKDTIVLRGGENIEPRPLEEKLMESEYINMVVVVGQDKSRLGALIVPNVEKLKSFCEKENIKFGDPHELIKNPKMISLFQKEVKSLISRENGFHPYETVIGLALLPQEFTVEAGELTETLKIKRFEIHRKYEEIINKICG